MDLGPRSERARQEVVTNLGQSIDGGYNESRRMMDGFVDFRVPSKCLAL